MRDSFIIMYSVYALMQEAHRE